MYPNTECPHDCYRPGDCDGLCTHPVAIAHSSNPVDAFRNTFAILHNLDDSELSFLTHKQRLAMRDNPCVAILRLDDARLDALYALVQSRQPERYRERV